MSDDQRRVQLNSPYGHFAIRARSAGVMVVVPNGQRGVVVGEMRHEFKRTWVEFDYFEGKVRCAIPSMWLEPEK